MDKKAPAVWLAAMGVVAAVPAMSMANQTDPETFIALEPISLPIVDGGRVDGSLDFTVVIAAADKSAAEALAMDKARLRETLVAAGLDFSHLYASSRTAVDARHLASTLEAAAKNSSRKVQKLYLTAVSAHPV